MVNPPAACLHPDVWFNPYVTIEQWVQHTIAEDKVGCKAFSGEKTYQFYLEQVDLNHDAFRHTGVELD